MHIRRKQWVNRWIWLALSLVILILAGLVRQSI